MAARRRRCRGSLARRRRGSEFSAPGGTVRFLIHAAGSRAFRAFEGCSSPSWSISFMLAWPPSREPLIFLPCLFLETVFSLQLASQLPSLFRPPRFTFEKERDKANHGYRDYQAESVISAAAFREPHRAGQFRSGGFRPCARSA